LRGGEDKMHDAARSCHPATQATTGRSRWGSAVRRGLPQVNQQVSEDLLRAELIAFPLTLGVDGARVRSVVAAGLPLLVGVLAIVGTFMVLLVVAAFTDVSIFALNLTTGMGLGLAIDYSLFIVSRYREELDAGRAPNDAVVRTVQTAGKTSRLAPSPLQSRSPRYSSSRSRSCGRSRMPASAGACSAGIAGRRPSGAPRRASAEGQLAALLRRTEAVGEASGTASRCS